MIEQKKLTESLKKTYENNLEFLLKTTRPEGGIVWAV